MENNTVEIEGYLENAQLLERLLTRDADFAKTYRQVIRKALQKARRMTSNDLRFNILRDPRAAYKAVKMSVYKSIFGGNISILNRKKAGAMKTSYHEPRTLKAGQRGGNRVPMSARTLQVMSYYGTDRAFILRWLEEGTYKTPNRQAGTRGNKLHGNRGGITAGHVFSSVAPQRLEQAINDIAEGFAEYINNQING